MTSIKEQISKSNSRRKEKVEVKDWGVEFYLSELSADDVIGLSNVDPETPMVEYWIHNLIRSAVDEDGKNIFDKADFDMLKQEPPRILKELFTKTETLAETKEKAKKN